MMVFKRLKKLIFLKGNIMVSSPGRLGAGFSKGHAMVLPLPGELKAVIQGLSNRLIIIGFIDFPERCSLLAPRHCVAPEHNSRAL